MNSEHRQKNVAVAALALIAFSLLFSNLSQLFQIFQDFVGIISPVLYGAAFAYLMNPIMNCVQRPLHRALERRNITARTAKRLSRGVAIVLALVVFIACIYVLVMMVVPQLAVSLQKLLSPSNLNSYYERIDSWLLRILKGSRFEEFYRANGKQIFDAVENWLTGLLLNGSAIMDAAQWALGAVMSVVDIMLGLVIAVYFLIYKDTFLAQAKKLTVAIFSSSWADRILETARDTNRMLNGFLVGKVIDSAIVGLICYAGMRIMRLPYPELISVVIGVTNIIPFFGPLLGTIPAALIILVENPLSAFYFVIFILALQQVDGNIIGPRILHGTVGLSDFWILVSITVFGGLFGFVGMVLGVPVFGVIYQLVKSATNRALIRKHQPVDTPLYHNISRVADLHPPHAEEAGDQMEFSAEYEYDEEYDEDYEEVEDAEAEDAGAKKEEGVEEL